MTDENVNSRQAASVPDRMSNWARTPPACPSCGDPSSGDEVEFYEVLDETPTITVEFTTGFGEEVKCYRTPLMERQIILFNHQRIDYGTALNLWYRIVHDQAMVIEMREAGDYESDHYTGAAARSYAAATAMAILFGESSTFWVKEAYRAAEAARDAKTDKGEDDSEE